MDLVGSRLQRAKSLLHTNVLIVYLEVSKVSVTAGLAKPRYLSTEITYLNRVRVSLELSMSLLAIGDYI